MKTRKFTWILAVILFLLPLSAAKADDGCRKKEQQLEKQLDYARAHNNTNRVIGLERALKQVRLNCTETGQKEKYYSKVQEKER